MLLSSPKSYLVIALTLFSVVVKAESVILISSNNSLGTFKKTIDQVVTASFANSNTSLQYFTEDLSMINDYKDFDGSEWAGYLNNKYRSSDVVRVAAVGPLARKAVSENYTSLLPNAEKYLIAGAKVTQYQNDFAPKVISEAERIDETIKLITTVIPTVKRIAVITGDLRDIDLIRKIKRLNGYDFDVNIWGVDTTYDEVLERAAMLSNDDAIIFAGKLTDSNGDRRSTESFISQLVSASSEPVFTTWSSALNSEVVGGAIVSPEKVGASIASLLKGTFTNKHNLVTTKMNFQALKNLGIDQSLLSDDVVFYNEPTLMWEDIDKLKRYGVVAITLLLFSLLLISGLARYQSRRAAIALENEQRLIAEQSKAQTLFGVIAHELRTPVSSISMMTEGSDNKDYQDINETAQDLLSTIDDMSLMVNPEYVREVRINTVELERFNEALSKRVAPLISSSGFGYHQELIVEDKYLTSFISSDFYRVRVAVSNLIRNACLHSQGKNVFLLTRSIEDQSANACYIEWEIRDDGVGIDESDINRLFEAHQRGQSKASGTGLGLYITKSLIEDIDGQVSYERLKEGGSKFVVRVPIKLAKQVNTTDIKLDDELLSKIQEKHILLVEDEAMLRMLGQKLVGSFSDNVQVAPNGKAALENFDPLTDIVITDYFMPEMDGFELTKALRKNGFEGLIIGATAATIGDQIKQLREAGCDDVISKPLTKEKLIASLCVLLKS